MTEKELIEIFVNSGKEEISTTELYELAVRNYAVDEKYDDYMHHIRTMQQHLKRKGMLVNTRRGYWGLTVH